MLLKSLIIFIAVEHLWIMIFEMFLWKTPYARKAFKMTTEFADSSAPLAKNQGLYNGFLAAGLVWSLVVSDAEFSHSIQLFFLSCVAIAGVVGALTANKRIFFIQTVPAIIAIALSLF